MQAKDIRFSKEIYFSAKVVASLSNLQEDAVYNYQVKDRCIILIDDNQVILGRIEISNDRNGIAEKLVEYKERSLLRLDSIETEDGTTLFTLLVFLKHINFKDGYDIVIDDAIYDKLEEFKLERESEIVNYLNNQLAYKGKYWFISSSNYDANEQVLYGKDIYIRIKITNQRYVHIVDIKRLKKTLFESRLVSVASGTIRFIYNAENIKPVSEEFIKDYQKATKNNIELLELWSIYDKLNNEAMLEAAEEIGALYYEGYSLKQGKIIFNLGKEKVLSNFLYDNMQYAVSNNKDFQNTNFADNIIIGSDIEKRCVGTHYLVIRDDRNEENQYKRIPKRGYIIPCITGTLVQSKRREIAERKIINCKANMVGLNVLLQTGEVVGNFTKEKLAITESLRRYAFGKNINGNFNERQKEAIKIAINTPDIAIIQGPPGTGKTKVIKAIVERINELENGKARILITSTQHDAVDNAIENVYYGGLPVNRVINNEENEEKVTTFDWIDNITSNVDNWLKNNEPEDKNEKIYHCMDALIKSNKQEIKINLQQLYTLLLARGCSAELLFKVNKMDVEMTEGEKEVQIEIEDEEYADLIEALDIQRLDYENFLIDGKKNLRSLELLLKYEYPELEFIVPKNWQKLKESNLDEKSFDKILVNYKKSLEAIRKKCCHSYDGDDSALDDSKVDFTDLAEQVEKELANIEDENPKQLLYEYVWKFKHELSNIKNVQNLIDSYSNINAATCQQAANKRISPAMHGFDDVYDYVIIDEAARSNPLDLLIPMSMGKKIILVGDHKQLPHIVEKKIVDAVINKTGNDRVNEVLEESLFMRLFNKIQEQDKKINDNFLLPMHVQRTCILNEQFRMHSQICDLVNVFYSEEALKTGCQDIDKELNLDLYNNKPLAWLDLLPVDRYPFESGGKSKARICEVECIKKELHKILKKNDACSIGIISFYSRQVDFISEMVNEEFPGDLDRISVGTVDSFQGKEFDIVILSTVRSNKQSEVGFLNNKNRLCVAFSRARSLLITIGDSSTVAANIGNDGVSPLYELLSRCKQEDKGYYVRIV